MGCHEGVCHWRFRFSEFPSLLTHQVSQVLPPYPSSIPPPTPAWYLQSSSCMGGAARGCCEQGARCTKTEHRPQGLFLVQLLRPPFSSFVETPHTITYYSSEQAGRGLSCKSLPLEILFFRISFPANTPSFSGSPTITVVDLPHPRLVPIALQLHERGSARVL